MKTFKNFFRDWFGINALSGWFLVVWLVVYAALFVTEGRGQNQDPSDLGTFANGAAVDDADIILIDDTSIASGISLKSLTWANLEAHFAQTSSLSTVATTGSFADLIDEPTSLATLNTALGSSIADGAHTVETNNLGTAVTWANIPDANVPESAVTQHEAALTITESQISDLNHTTDTDTQLSEVQVEAGVFDDDNTGDMTTTGDITADTFRTGGGTTSAPDIALNDDNSGFNSPSAAGIDIIYNAIKRVSTNANNFVLGKDTRLGFDSTATADTTPDFELGWDEADVLALKDGTNDTAFKIYSTDDGAGNFERWGFATNSSGELTISAEYGGTGDVNKALILNLDNDGLEIKNQNATVNTAGWRINQGRTSYFDGHLLIEEADGGGRALVIETDKDLLTYGNFGWASDTNTFLQNDHAADNIGIQVAAIRRVNVHPGGLTIQDDSALGWAVDSAHADSTNDFELTRSATDVLSLDAAFALEEMATAPTGEANKAIIFAEDNGSGKTRLMVQFGTGSAQQLAIEP